jgi:hypothetical protein
MRREWMNMGNMRIAIGAALVGLAIAASGTDVHAAEEGKGFYLLGSRAHMAGILPGPGSYFANEFYFYDGGANVSVDFPIGDLVVQGGLDATVAIDLMTGLHVLPGEILGGSLAIGLTLPMGWQEIGVRGTVTGPNGQVSGATSEDDFEVGDPVLVAALGWHDGNMHWQLGGLLNVPIGSYDADDLVNLGFNRWAFDLTGSATYLDLATGIEMSGALGFTFNGENLDTGYKSGTEFHAEFAASKLFANGMSLGVVGYHYQQLSGDSGGSTASQQALLVLTDGFKGRTTTIGPSVGMMLPVGDRMLNINLRWYHELEVKYRPEGDAVLFSASVPLQADPMMAAAK